MVNKKFIFAVPLAVAIISSAAMLPLSIRDARAQDGGSPEANATNTPAPTPTATPTATPTPPYGEWSDDEVQCSVFKYEHYTVTNVGFEERDLYKLIKFNGNREDPIVKLMSDALSYIVDICHAMRDIDDAANAAGCQKNPGQDGPVGCRASYFAQCQSEMADKRDVFGNRIPIDGMCWTMIQDGRANKGIQGCGHYGIGQWLLGGGDFGEGYLIESLANAGVNFWAGFPNQSQQQDTPLPQWLKDAYAATNFTNGGSFPLEGLFHRLTMYIRVVRDAAGKIVRNANGTPKIIVEPEKREGDKECEGAYGADGSPISLVLDEKEFAEEGLTMVNFSLDGRTGGWSAWRGSKAAPLLVKLKGKKLEVTSAEQLFGNWTSGGRLEVSGSRRPYENGYEALEVEDRNGDGKVSGAELKGLGLWSDLNRNGKSESGEVQPVSKFGIHTIHYKGFEKLENGDIVLQTGYERTVNGKNVVGRSIDWFAPTAPTAELLLAALQARPTTQRTEDVVKLNAELARKIGAAAMFTPGTPEYNGRVSKGPAISNDVAGVWKFTLEGRAGPSGFLLINRDPATNHLLGTSVVVSGNPKKIGDPGDRLLQLFQIKGKSTESGSTGAWFLPGQKGTITETTFEVQNGTLVGKSRATVKFSKEREDKISYTWTAERIL